MITTAVARADQSHHLCHSLVVGLAAQDTLSNLFGAVAIFADKPFRAGDHIQLDGVEGTVETIVLFADTNR